MKKKKFKVELNEQFNNAYDLMEHSIKNLFITGRAGTGKSTLLSYFRDHTTKNVVVLAPTGVAAVNIKGQTIHSFFHFKPDITTTKVRKMRVDEQSKKIYERLQTIVIDEISMVRADLLDCIDLFLRLHGPNPGRSFGGVQMIFIGDLYQLPPVMTQNDAMIFKEHYDTPYFFSAHAINPRQESLLGGDSRFEFVFVELDKIYRQKDAEFIRLLNGVRDNTATQEDFEALNARHNAAFSPKPDEMYMHLTTTNAMADVVNEQKLAEIDADLFFFNGVTEGQFSDSYLPTAKDLMLKIGAQVMMLNNDLEGRWINGSVGKVLSVDGGVDGEPRSIMVELENGVIERVLPHKWDVYEFSYNKAGNRIESESVGSFIQYPLKLAWAVTIHKSQGKTFEKVVLDIGRGTFSAGQLYVALSRATTLGGIVLKKPIFKHYVWLDDAVRLFIQSCQSAEVRRRG